MKRLLLLAAPLLLVAFSSPSYAYVRCYDGPYGGHCVRYHRDHYRYHPYYRPYYHNYYRPYHPHYYRHVYYRERPYYYAPQPVVVIRN
jgi:hypothetical protein